MQNLIDYLKHSTIVLSFNFNPYHWFKFPYYVHVDMNDDMNPGQIIHASCKFLFVKLLIVIDDGRW